MGYRSEVAIKCEAKAYERFKKIFDNEDLYIKPDKILHDSEYDDYVLYWDWIKWYSSYDGVKMIEHLMDVLDDEHECESEDGLGYRFVRLGEDDTDVETRENDYELELWITRAIDIPDDWETIGGNEYGY